ncbi:EF-hand calcium-binding domain-containing protein 11 [Entophlyctis luteolus]|nr:EF-hand calcium-binding domain-containing protein 11 [Entophlyctis luteolus]
MTESVFIDMMLPRLASTDADEMMRQMFVAMDLSGNGFISQNDMEEVFRRVAGVFDANALRVWFSEVDADGDGKVRYRDFMALVSNALEAESRT